jgi:hypothetical protein
MSYALCRVMNVINVRHEIVNVYILFNTRIYVFLYVKRIFMITKDTGAGM